MVSKQFLLSLTNYQDSLLQSYRTIFISSQTIIISIASLIASLSSPSVKLLVMSLFLLGTILILLWIYICWIQGLYSSYCQMQLDNFENGVLDISAQRKPMFSFREFQKKKLANQEKIIKDWYGKVTWYSIRILIGIILPIIYLIVWFVILFGFC